MVILDKNLSPIPTTGGTALLQIDFNSANPMVQVFAGDPTPPEAEMAVIGSHFRACGFGDESLSAGPGFSLQRSRERLAQPRLDVERHSRRHVLRRLLRYGRHASLRDEHLRNQLLPRGADARHGVLLANRGQERLWHRALRSLVLHHGCPIAVLSGRAVQVGGYPWRGGWI